ncbi:lysine--tRNA ligase [Legionella pneumophila]|uniref:Lysine--tRNA ligase n=1 Tax=Legionella pneumophila subsp. pascullei TaxID=91890 RepID=A0AAX2IZJ7_LEGPN|nr:lysine--tRNA ligase [Legionella pneumophila]AMP89579.1 lysine--tRNA ligase [Legionella pneumophila subsp. pascullei]AMP92755.1 lysine--tRNA ligase [Legionella pneumophila subsp. pascullei]AMP95721.1 lysine--tRNA ligase [Legionella pneumophila subsp. pascullei]SQG90633.1 lysyl-tRNA synthetase, class II [Legionella pneumophila subsp. pascullei]VEH07178.1 lysyl-tRNA synthetase, class II [Legionella pneumophila subsp. pascullei]
MSEEHLHLDESEVYHIRKQKLAELRTDGFNFPNKFRREHLADALLKQYSETEKETLEQKHVKVSVAGRIVLRRIMGKASFFHIQDVSGRIQVYLRSNDLPEVYEQFKHWDLGDIVGVQGELFKTNTGELTINAEHIELLTKSLRPLPDKFHGLADQELKYRKRYVDLIANEDSRKTFLIRSHLIKAFREFMDDNRFLEVETPMMHPIPGGALARPFVTHHNTLDMTMYLRIAPELYLKRLVVGGFERVYEINRNFRNEGISTRHNPEFTMLEFYQAYADYNDLMNFTEQLFHYLCDKVLGTRQIEYQGQIIDFNKPFGRLSVKEAILKYHPDMKAQQLETVEGCRTLLNDLGLPYKETDGLGKLQIILFEETVEHQLFQPTFITEYPTEISPLARRSDTNPEVTDRFEFFIAGREIANGFSELNDAEDQAERFRKQVEEKDAGDLEAMHFDSDYIEALEYGLPPTAGEGIGIDRLVMLFTNSQSIRDVILFPHLRQ